MTPLRRSQYICLLNRWLRYAGSVVLICLGLPCLARW